MPRKLAEGVYEHLVTEGMERGFEELDPAIQRAVEQLGEADGHLTLARHLGLEVARVLGSLPREGRVEAGRELVTRLIRSLESVPGVDKEALAEQGLRAPARRPLSLHRGGAPDRPATPLATSTLLTRNRAEPSLGHELAREIAISDRVDAVVAFVTVSGVRAIREALESFARAGSGRRMRLLTTVFGGITEVEALDQLGALPGVEIKVSFDVRRTRLHAKAWLFHRETGLTTAYVGSANLTATALGGGQEWMVKLCASDLPHVIDKFEGTFETLWQDPEFEVFDPKVPEHRERLTAARRARAGARGGRADTVRSSSLSIPGGNPGSTGGRTRCARPAKEPGRRGHRDGKDGHRGFRLRAGFPGGGDPAPAAVPGSPTRDPDPGARRVSARATGRGLRRDVDAH